MARSHRLHPSRLCRTVGAIAFALLGAGPGAAQQSLSPDSVARIARTLGYDGKYAESATRFREAAAAYVKVGRTVDQLSALREAGEAMLQAGDRVAARRDFRTAQTLDSATAGPRADAYFLLLVGLTFRLDGRNDSAMVWYESARRALRRQGFTHFIDLSADDETFNKRRAEMTTAAEELVKRHPSGPCMLGTGREWRRVYCDADSTLANRYDSLSALVAKDDGPTPRDGSFDGNGVLSVVLGEIAAIYREQGREDTARVLFRHAATAASKAAMPLRTDVLGGAPEHIHLMYVCANATRPAFCKRSSNPTDQLRTRAAEQRFLGDIEGEAETLATLDRQYTLIGSDTEKADVTRLRRNLDRYRSNAAPSEVGHTGIDATPTPRPGSERSQTQALMDRADSLLAAGAPDRALTVLFDARRLLTNLLDPDQVTRRVSLTLVFADIARIYHRKLRNPDLFRATLYYDSASTTALNAVALSLTDEQRTNLADQLSALYSDWAMAWLARGKSDPSGIGTMRALGAVEEGRARALQLARGVTRERDYLSNEVRGAGDALGMGSALSLKSKEVLLDYLVAGDTLVIWTQNESQETDFFVVPIDSAELRNDIATVRAAMSPRAEAVRPSAANEQRGVGVTHQDMRAANAAISRLYAVLFPDSVRAQIGADAPLAIVPDGILDELPFGVLRADTTSDQLAIKHALRYAPAIAMLGQRFDSSMPRALNPCLPGSRPEECAPFLMPESPTTSVRHAFAVRIDSLRRIWLSKALVIGNPKLPVFKRADTGRPIVFESLPGARQEAIDVAKRLGVKPLLDAAATESAARKRMPSAPVIHLATHGLAYSDAHFSRRSFVALGADVSRAAAGSDGALEAGELLGDSTLTLTAELVILSACETALGSTSRSEGTIGLERAFLARGARTVIVSQWSVPDAATRLLMEEFYKAWLDPTVDGDKAVALQRAQQRVRSRPEFRDPYYWAAFQVVGAP